MNANWNSVILEGKTIDILDPGGEGQPRFGLLYLHDVDGKTLAHDAAATALLAEQRVACVCPRGGPCWWANRIWTSFDPRSTPERFLLDKVVPLFAEKWGLMPPALGLLGVGMGGQGALRLAFKHSRKFPVVAALNAALDHHDLYGSDSPLDEMYDSKEQCRQDTALLHIHPSDYPLHLSFACDPDNTWYRGNDRLHEKLSALGIPHEHDLTGAGDLLKAIRFVYEGLVKQSRRLL